MIIDAHQHFWDPSRGDYDWLTPGSDLYRSFGPNDLSPLLNSCGVAATIVVQAAPTALETDHLLNIAKATSWVAGVVGWVDLETDDVADAVASRASSSLFVGIRPMLQDLPDRAWILRPELRPGLEAIERAELVFDALVRFDQLGVVEQLARQHPSLTIMVDHAAKPPFRSANEMSEWLGDLAQVAIQPNTCCKLSGLLTELPVGHGASEIVDSIRHLIELFGPDRLVWGSDWPVLTLADEYGSWIELCCSELERYGRAVKDAVLGGNARRIYKLALN